MSPPPDDKNDWIRYSNVDERTAPLLRRRQTSSAVLFSGLLIAAGVLLFLGNVGILPIYNVWQFWPVFVIVGGVSRLTSATTPASRIWGGFLIGLGALLLLHNLGVLQLATRDGGWIFSLLLIILGVLGLTRAFESSGGLRRVIGTAPQFSTDNYRDMLMDLTIFGNVKRKSESRAFKGGELTSVFGQIEVDLRQAMISSPDGTAVLNVTAVFGGINIRVPQHWRVYVSGSSILGSFEDNTVPPNVGENAPTLVIAGLAVLGSVEIKD